MKDIQEARGHNYFPSYVGQSLEHKELRKYLLLELFIMSANIFQYFIYIELSQHHSSFTSHLCQYKALEHSVVGTPQYDHFSH